MNNFPKTELPVTAARFEDGTAKSYRLVKKPDGELVLQGCFMWHQGRMGGFAWRDIPTVLPDDSPPTPQGGGPIT